MNNPANEPITIRKLCPKCGQVETAGLSEKCPVDGSNLVVFPQDALIGTTIADRYHLRSLLGEGGWSTVYKAEDLSLSRIVAVKVMQAQLISHADRVMRFKREAQAISSFTHPNIRAVYDFGILNSGQPYMVMEYLDGRPLSEVIKDEGALSVRRTVAIFTQAGAALQCAHEKGIVHRDIKPSNIMMLSDADRMDMVKVTDFGLAKFMDHDSSTELTASGETVGTAAYMSPEQCLGKDLQHYSDIYSLGCVVYEALTGRKAVDGRANECLLKHLNETPPSFSEVRSDLYIPEFIEAIVFKAMQKNPADRFASVKEMSDALNYNLKVASTERLAAGTVAPQRIASIKNNALPMAALTLTLACLGYCVYIVLTTMSHPGAPIPNNNNRNEGQAATGKPAVVASAQVDPNVHRAEAHASPEARVSPEAHASADAHAAPDAHAAADAHSADQTHSPVASTGNSKVERPKIIETTAARSTGGIAAEPNMATKNATKTVKPQETIERGNHSEQANQRERSTITPFVRTASSGVPAQTTQSSSPSHLAALPYRDLTRDAPSAIEPAIKPQTKSDGKSNSKSDKSDGKVGNTPNPTSDEDEEHQNGTLKGGALNYYGTPLTDAALAEKLHTIDENSLTQLAVGWTKISDQSMTEIARFKQLRKLNVGHTQVTAAGLENILVLTKLNSLSVQYLKLSPPWISKLRSLHFLESLNLAGKYLTSDDFKAVSTLTQVKRLVIWYCSISDQEMLFLRDMPSLASLELGKVKLGEQGMSILGSFPHLETLELNEMGVLGSDAFQPISKIKGLNHLLIKHCDVTIDGIAFLKASKLEKVEFIYSNISDAGLSQLQEIAGLKRINLRHVGASAQAVAKLEAAGIKVNFVP